MISCLTWLKKGYAKETPLTNEEIDRQMAEIMEEAKKYKEKYENEDETVIPNLVKESDIQHQMEEDNMPFGFEESEEEKDEYKILKDDNLFIAGKIEEEFAALEVYVYEKHSGNLFVHH